MKRIGLVLLITFTFVQFLCGQPARKEINLPDIPGYLTLKCDFHIHTVFSDGSVWPTVRVNEAWQEGLDAIAITEHIEHRPHSKDVLADHNRSYEIAKPAADSKGLLLIRGAEITRGMPPGHFNVFFIKNANLLERENVLDALKEAREQGAFILWNHPGWKAQQPDTTKWFDIHTQLYDNDLMHGLEIYNFDEYYPIVFEWALKKGLTILSNSDVHEPIDVNFDVVNSHRPLTLVFAKEKTNTSLKEALFAGRTAGYFGNSIVGAAKFLKPLFSASLEILTSRLFIGNHETKYIQVHNNADIDFVLEASRPSVGIDFPRSVILKANRTVMLEVTGNSNEVKNMKQVKLYYKVKNMLVAPEKPLEVEITIDNR